MAAGNLKHGHPQILESGPSGKAPIPGQTYDLLEDERYADGYHRSSKGSSQLIMRLLVKTNRSCRPIVPASYLTEPVRTVLSIRLSEHG